MAKQVRDDIDKFMDYNIFLPTRTIWVGPDDTDGETNLGMATRVIKNLHILESRSSDNITILMNNPGGEVVQGLAIYDAIRACKSHITIKASGLCESMATLILQAADTRLISPNVQFMVHEGTTSFETDHVQNIKNKMAWEEKQDLVCNTIYLAKIKDKHPTYTLKRLTSEIKFDKLLDAKEVIELGLADGIFGEVDEEVK